MTQTPNCSEEKEHLKKKKYYLAISVIVGGLVVS